MFYYGAFLLLIQNETFLEKYSVENYLTLKVNTEMESPCIESSQCVRISASCIDGQCICPLKMHNVKGICYRSAEIGSPCDRHEECVVTNNTQCSDKTCTCTNDYIYSKKFSQCLLKAYNISSVCLANKQCSITLGFGSQCYQGFCKCKEIYNYKSSINKCVLDAFLGNECENHSNCLQIGNDEDRLECFLGVCVCKLPFVEQYGYCVKNSGWTWTSFTLPDVLPFLLTYSFFYVIR